MIAKQLETFLLREANSTDYSHRTHGDLVQRFHSLRQHQLLPKGRGKNAENLSSEQIVAGILSLISTRPAWAGIASKSLMNLRPIGGVEASYLQSGSFGGALAMLLDDEDALSNLIEVRASGSEIFNNGHGSASIAYRRGENWNTAFYIGATAVSLLKKDADKSYSPQETNNPVLIEYIYNRSFFARLVSRRKSAWSLPTRVGPADLQVWEEEKSREVRAERLKISPGASYLNLAVDTQVTWPDKETLIYFEEIELVLMPKTRDNSTSIHIDLKKNRISQEIATTISNRFLSILSWCDDQFAILQGGWSGNPVPVPVPRRNLGASIASNWVFNRKSPDDKNAQKALAIYRDARNAEQNFLVPYAVLCYYKIIETRHRGPNQIQNWFRTTYPKLVENQNLVESIARFKALLGPHAPEVYLYKMCRNAVAHATDPFTTDPDEADELRRLHVAADILRALARIFIREEIIVSESMYDGS